MADDHTTNNNPSKTSFDALVLNQLPKENFWNTFEIYKWEGFWFNSQILRTTIDLQTQFEARPGDIILTSSIKTGTTWLKALCAYITTQQSFNDNHDVLVKNSPHVHIPTIESMIFGQDPTSLISSMPSPRLIHSHLPWNLLPDSIKTSNCKIIYMSRNPKDTFVSWWHFNNTILNHRIPLHEAFEVFVSGKFLHGPFFDHVLQYWNASLAMPDRILFLKYEDLKSDPKAEVRKLVSFLGKQISSDDEGQIDEILEKCSIERLKNLEVNKNGEIPWNGLPSSCFYRKGVAGDSKNYLTNEMEERMDSLTREKFEESGLVFDFV